MADRKQLEQLQAEARKLIGKDVMTAAEKALAEQLVDKIERMKLDIKTADALRSVDDDSVVEYAGKDVFSRIKAAGWDHETKTRVSLGTYGAKAIMADGTDGNIVPFALEGDGQDRRYAHTAFPSFGLGDATSVQGLVQTVRTLATPADMDVAIAGSAAKPESVLTVALATTDAKMIAHVSEALPNALVKLPAFKSFIGSEMEYGLGLGIDSFLITSLAGASGTLTSTQTTETLFDFYRARIASMRAYGYSPDLALVHPNDAVDLDTLRDGVDQYYGNGPANVGTPLWGLKVVESTSVTEGSPILVDSKAFGKVYFGAAEFASNSFSDGTIDLFGTNQTKVRLEVPMCVLVQRAEAIYELTLA